MRKHAAGSGSIGTPDRLAAALLVVLLVVACGPNQMTTPAPRTSPLPTDGPSQPSGSLPATVRGPTLGPTSSPISPSSTPLGQEFNFELSVDYFGGGFPPLTLVTNAGDGSGLLYAVGQNGVISVLSYAGSVQVEPFLDIDDRIRSGAEQGLLGLAFHPDYESNGRLFVNYTNNDGDTVVSEFSRLNNEPSRVLADPGSERILLTIDQPYGNHNGGMVAFGTDGFLYIGMGDGGSGGDPMGNGQAPATFLGKMLRIDVNTGDPYGIPGDNPFLDGTALPEIWSMGWRNPWRFSFDRETGAMFAGDVGQGAREEIDAEPPGEGGRNYGWSVMEGDLCYRTDPCDTDGLTLPVAVNDRSNGECAVTGGYVYRGANYPELLGAYVFSDYCAGTLWALDANSAVATGTAQAVELGNAGFGPSSFGEDETGEIYVVNLRGEIHRLVATPR